MLCAFYKAKEFKVSTGHVKWFQFGKVMVLRYSRRRQRDLFVIIQRFKTNATQILMKTKSEYDVARAKSSCATT
jgi:hypothetical protein